MFSFRSLSGSVALSLTLLAVLPTAVRAAAPDAQDRERKLIAVLQSDAAPAEKAMTCKKLAVYGSKEAVPALAPLLLDKDLTSWSRIALEAITDPAADAALRDALTKAQGRILVGIINSIGFRHDAKAVGPLTAKLADPDATVVAAAANALGKIGGDAAARALEPLLATAPAAARADVAEGCVLCAEHFLAQGNATAATRLYDLVRQANVPKQKKNEATRGAILARGAAGLPLLVEQLRSTDKGLFNIGLRTARELPGSAVTIAVASELDQAAPERQAPLVLVLADRGDASVLPAVRKAAQSPSKPVRLAATSALERMGTVACVPALLELATDEDRDLSQAAKASLVRIPGKEINADLVARLPQATGKVRSVLLDLVAQRRLAEALPAVIQATSDADPAIRAAAITALGTIGEEKQVADLVALLPKAPTPREREDLEKALLAITGRRGASALSALAPLAQSTDANLRVISLHALSSVGGAPALATVKAALTDADPTVQDEAVRTLASWPGNWPDDTAVAEPLLTLAKTSKKTSHQVLGVRGYLEYLQGDKKLADDAKVAQVKEMLPLITRTEEKRLAIAVGGSILNGATLELLTTLAADPSVSEEASLAIVALAVKTDLKAASSAVRQKALQAVIDTTKNDRTRRKAEDALKKVR